jgi:hypothetical protein
MAIAMRDFIDIENLSGDPIRPESYCESFLFATENDCHWEARGGY